MSRAALADERFSRAGAAIAALLAAIPIAAMGGATLIAPFVLVCALVATPWARLPHGMTSAGLPLYIASAFLVWVVLSTLWTRPDIGTQGAYDLAAFAPFALLLAAAAGLSRLPDRVLAWRAAIAGVGLLVAIAAIETNLNFPIGRQLAPAAERSAFYVASPDEQAGPEAPLTSEVKPPPAKKLRNSDASLFYPDAARTALILLACMWGAGAVLARSGWRGWVLLAGLFAGAFWISLSYGGGVNTAALVLGTLAAGLALIWPRATVSLVAQTLAALIVFAPLALPYLADLSAQIMATLAAWKPAGAEPMSAPPLVFLDPPFGWLHRVHGWSHTSELIRERLVSGWGFGASIQFDEVLTLRNFTVPYIPRHPHNALLQIWLETGAVGALLAAGALASFGRRAGAALADDRIAAAAAAGLLVTAAVIVNVSGGAWSLWWWGAVALGAALVRVAKRPS